MDNIRPVIEGLEEYEVGLGGENADQPQYNELAALRSPEGIVTTRWTFTEEERNAIAAGEDIYLLTMTFNHPFQPVMLQVGIPEGKENFKRKMRLDDEMELRTLLNEVRGLAQQLQDKQIAILNADKQLRELAEETERAKKLLEKKKAEVFSEKKSGLVLVN